MLLLDKERVDLTNALKEYLRPAKGAKRAQYLAWSALFHNDHEMKLDLLQWSRYLKTYVTVASGALVLSLRVLLSLDVSEEMKGYYEKIGPAKLKLKIKGLENDCYKKRAHCLFLEDFRWGKGGVLAAFRRVRAVAVFDARIVASLRQQPCTTQEELECLKLQSLLDRIGRYLVFRFPLKADLIDTSLDHLTDHLAVLLECMHHLPSSSERSLIEKVLRACLFRKNSADELKKSLESATTCSARFSSHVLESVRGGKTLQTEWQEWQRQLNQAELSRSDCRVHFVLKDCTQFGQDRAQKTRECWVDTKEGVNQSDTDSTVFSSSDTFIVKTSPDMVMEEHFLEEASPGYDRFSPVSESVFEFPAAEAIRSSDYVPVSAQPHNRDDLYVYVDEVVGGSAGSKKTCSVISVPRPAPSVQGDKKDASLASASSGYSSDLSLPGSPTQDSIFSPGSESEKSLRKSENTVSNESVLVFWGGGLLEDRIRKQDKVLPEARSTPIPC